MLKILSEVSTPKTKNAFYCSLIGTADLGAMPNQTKQNYKRLYWEPMTEPAESVFYLKLLVVYLFKNQLLALTFYLPMPKTTVFLLGRTSEIANLGA